MPTIIDSQTQSFSRWKLLLAAVLLACFALQSLMRIGFLGQIVATGRLGMTTPIVHVLSLACFVGIAAMMLVIAHNRPIWQIFVSLTLAASVLILVAFDITARVTLPVIFTVMPLDAILDFYCTSRNISVCASTFWPQTLSASSLLLVCASLIWICADALAILIRSVWQRTVQLVGRWFAGTGLAIMLLGYGACWAAVPAWTEPRDQLYGFLTTPRENVGPPQLVWGKRPDFKVEASPNVQRRPIVLITIDSIRADSVELRPGKPSLTPFLQSLARTGRLHNLGPSTAICPYSYCGTVAIQSGKSWADPAKVDDISCTPILLLAEVLSNVEQAIAVKAGIKASTAEVWA